MATTTHAAVKPTAPDTDTIRDLAALKTRQHAAWSSGDYAIVGTTLQIVGEELCEALDLRPGQSILDVAAGNGNATLAAARRWCDVVSTDYVPSLLERGQLRAKAEGLPVEFKVADAEALPFADAAFDIVVSTFGVMFTPDQDKAASELLRVCKGGGKIGLANWTPEGFIGQLFKTLGKYLPPPAGAKSPALGHAVAHHRDVWGGGHIGQGRASPFHVPLSLARSFPRDIQELLRPDAESLCSARRNKSGRAPSRSAGFDRRHQCSVRRHHDRSKRISGNRHHQTLNAFIWLQATTRMVDGRMAAQPSGCRL
jgi:SAM-dependent methyltransferase